MQSLDLRSVYQSFYTSNPLQAPIQNLNHIALEHLFFSRRFYYQKEVCERILKEFGLQGSASHIINGHTPVRTVKGELPIRADGKLLVIDGGFCKNYHEKTGIAGYTLIYNSHGLRLKAHQPFESLKAALRSNSDIHSSSEIVETEHRRMLVFDTDDGSALQTEIGDLCCLLDLYRRGVLSPKE